jgi:hypothetical protein
MNYEEFVSKWVGKYLYEDDMIHSLAGMIKMFKAQQYNHPIYGKTIIDVFDIPTFYGWKDEKQRRQFYNDAKNVGVKRKPHEKNEWYKLINIL